MDKDKGNGEGVDLSAFGTDIAKLMDDISSNTLLTIVDCHI